MIMTATTPKGHTQGPWKVGKSKDGQIPLATQPPAIMAGKDYIAILGGGSIHFRDAEANAALIAAAPETAAERDRLRAECEALRAALEDVAALIKTCDKCSGTGQRQGWPDGEACPKCGGVGETLYAGHEINTIRAALAKGGK